MRQILKKQLFDAIDKKQKQKVNPLVLPKKKRFKWWRWLCH